MHAMAAPYVVKEERDAISVKVEAQEYQIYNPAIVEISSSSTGSDNRSESPAPIGHNEINSLSHGLHRKRFGKRARVQIEDPEQRTRDIGALSGIHSLRERPASLMSHVRSNDKVIRQFWKAGDYEIDQSVRKPGGCMDHVRVHPKFLHSNATSHKWALGAIAELLDNALDEVANGATYVNVDMIRNPKDSEPMLTVEDDGGGMNPENMRQCMSLGYSAKSKIPDTIGQYGNGFKTSTMRLGADVIVFSRCRAGKGGCPTQSIGILSYTFLRETGQQDIIVPIIDYEIQPLGLKKLIRRSADDWNRNMEAIKRWSPYSTESELLDQFKGMKSQGTKILIYNLWEDDEGELEVDFDADPYDIQLRGANRDEKNIEKAKQLPNSWHYLTYKHSLRSYASILYLRLPPFFKMFLRGKEIQHHNLIDDLMFTQVSTYRPQATGDAPAEREPGQMKAVVTIGFVKDAKEHINIQGFNVYHKNRLIKPFWRMWNASSSQGRGAVGVLEANFLEPAHDKQGFERTVVLARLEHRLVEMQRLYWHKNCQKVGYVNSASKSKKGSEQGSYQQSRDKISLRTEQLVAASSQRDRTLETLSADSAPRTVYERPIFLSPHGNTSADLEAHALVKPSGPKTPLQTCLQVQIAVPSQLFTGKEQAGKKQLVEATSCFGGVKRSQSSQGPAAEESIAQQSFKSSSFSNKEESHFHVHKMLTDRGVRAADAQAAQDCVALMTSAASLPRPCMMDSHGDLVASSRSMEAQGTCIQPLPSSLQNSADQLGLGIAGFHDMSSISTPLKAQGTCAQLTSISLQKILDQGVCQGVVSDGEHLNVISSVGLVPQTVKGLSLHPGHGDLSSISTTMQASGACTQPLSSSLQRSADQLASDSGVLELHVTSLLANACQTEEVCRAETQVAAVFGGPVGGESFHNHDSKASCNSSAQLERADEDTLQEMDMPLQNTLLPSLTYKDIDDNHYKEALSVPSEPTPSVDHPLISAGRPESPFVGGTCVTIDGTKETSSPLLAVKSTSPAAVTDFPQTSGSEVAMSPCELADPHVCDHGPSSCVPMDCSLLEVIPENRNAQVSHFTSSALTASQASVRSSQYLRSPLGVSPQRCSIQDAPPLEGPVFDIPMKEVEMIGSGVPAQDVRGKMNKAIKANAYLISTVDPSFQVGEAVCSTQSKSIVNIETLVDTENHENLSREMQEEQVALLFIPQKMGDISEQEKGSFCTEFQEPSSSSGQNLLEDPCQEQVAGGEKPESGLYQQPSCNGILSIIEIEEPTCVKPIIEMMEADSNALVVHGCDWLDQRPERLTELEEEVKLLEKELDMAVAERDSLKQKLEQEKMDGWLRKVEMQKVVEEAWAKFRELESQTSLVELT